MWLTEDVYICPAGEKLAYHYTIEENGLVSAPLLDQRLPELRYQAQLHHRQGTTDHAMGTRAHSRSRSTPARRASGEDAPAARDGRASVRHHQGQDGSNPLPDEDPATSCLRDGAARAGLQSDPGHEHHGHSAAHGRDEGLAKPEKRLLNAFRPKLLRFDTSGKAFLHNQDPKRSSQWASICVATNAWTFVR